MLCPNSMLLDLFIPVECLFILHALEVPNYIVIVVILSLAHFKALYSECIVNFFMNGCLVSRSYDNLTLSIDAQLCTVNHIGKLIDQ